MREEGGGQDARCAEARARPQHLKVLRHVLKDVHMGSMARRGCRWAEWVHDVRVALEAGNAECPVR